MKKKKLPLWIKSEFLQKFLRSKVGTVLSYWVFQGMLYADYREVLIKVFVDLFFTGILAFVFSLPVGLSFLLAHTLNMLFNGHFIAMRRHMGLGVNDPARFIAYVEAFSNRVKRKPYIRAAAAYGSLTRNAYRATSDIDVRLIPKNDVLSFFGTCLFALAERSRALFFAFPLDMYVFDMSGLKNKMNLEEAPMIFHDPERVLESSYERVIDADQVIAAFRAIHV